MFVTALYNICCLDILLHRK